MNGMNRRFIFGALGMTMGLFALIGTITAGFFTDHLGVVAVLNIQAAGYVFGGLLVLALLPREKDTVPLQTEPAPADLTSMQSES